jgi:hypothetical protein
LKANIWEQRDEARRKKYAKLNNETLDEVSHEKLARIGTAYADKEYCTAPTSLAATSRDVHFAPIKKTSGYFALIKENWLFLLAFFLS